MSCLALPQNLFCTAPCPTETVTLTPPAPDGNHQHFHTGTVIHTVIFVGISADRVAFVPEFLAAAATNSDAKTHAMRCVPDYDTKSQRCCLN